MQRPPDYGIIYNWDGAPHGYSEYPQSMEQFLDKTYSVMKDTQVGAHFWSTGGSEDGDLRLNKPDSYTHARHFTQSANILSMYDRGEDPHAALIQRGHELGMHVYASVRMNDNHFGGMQPHEMEQSKHPSLTQFRRSHCQGDGDSARCSKNIFSTPIRSISCRFSLGCWRRRGRPRAMPSGPRRKAAGMSRRWRRVPRIRRKWAGGRAAH